MNSKYFFVVDTSEYAGGFIDSMCGYMTGLSRSSILEACQMKDKFPEEAAEFEEMSITDYSDYTNPLVCTLYPSPNLFNDGVGNIYSKDQVDSSTVIDLYMKTVKDQNSRHIEELERQLLEGRGVQHALESRRRYLKEILDRGPGQYPAYNSIAITFDRIPTSSQIEFLKRRAIEYAKTVHKPQINITGFRLIEVKTVEEEIPI
jgi:hypothetical protein